MLFVSSAAIVQLAIFSRRYFRLAFASLVSRDLLESASIVGSARTSIRRFGGKLTFGGTSHRVH